MAVARRRLKHAGYDLLHLGVNIRSDFAQRLWWRVEARLDDFRRSRSFERGFSGQCVIERSAKAVYVGAIINALSPDLLRGYVIGRSPYALGAVLIRDGGYAEVNQLGLHFVVEEYVLWFYVAVNKADFDSFVQALGYAEAYFDYEVLRERFSCGYQFAEVAASDEFHYYIRLPACLSERVNLGYVGVVQFCGGLRLVAAQKCDILIERKNPQVIYGGEAITGIDAIIPRIGASVTFYGTAVVRQFEMMKVFTTTESQALVRSRDKLRSMQILTRSGVGIPKTVFTNYSKDVGSIVDNVGGAPCIIKLLEGTQGLGVVLAETKKAAVAVCEAFNSLKARVIVQEFIKESRGIDIRAFVVDGRVVGAMKRTGKEGEFRSNLHRGGTAELITLTHEEEVTAIKAAKALGLHVAGVDLLQSDRGPLVIEVNSSPGLEGIEKATGEDIAGEIVKFIERNV